MQNVSTGEVFDTCAQLIADAADSNSGSRIIMEFTARE